MGKKLDKMIAAGGTVASAVSVWDRISGWWRKRSKRRAEERAAEERQEERDLEQALNWATDDAEKGRGNGPCALSLTCGRPKFHAGSCGPAIEKPGVKL